VEHARQAGAAGAASSPRRNGRKAKPIRASSSPRSSALRQERGNSTRTSTAPAATWRNRIKECQLDLYADRTSAATMRANQLRLWFASMAYVLICALRRIGLAETVFADATCGTIRLKLLKIGALIRISVRRIKIAMASACPAAEEWGRAARPPGRRRQGPRRTPLTRAAATRPIARHHPPAHGDP